MPKPSTRCLVITTLIGNSTVCRVMVDNGSAINIIYVDAVWNMGFNEQYLKPCSMSIYGFTRNSLLPKGTISLPVMLGEEPRTTKVMAEFLVVDCLTTYNVILGRSILDDMDTMTSVCYQAIKFSTPSRVEV